MKDLARLRKSYERAELDEAHSASSPLAQFDHWLHEALTADLPEPTAMTLATVDPGGRPSTRVVLLKGCDARGFVWYTNYESRKAQELATNPQAALQFHWVELERVVRIEGRVEKTSTDESDAYYGTRPLDSRIGAWASPQSRVIASRATLVAEAARIGAKFLLAPPRPPHWGGYRLVPDTFEFWQGRRSRLHDRLRYTLQADGTWLRQRLAP
jgi:pyridoxamine 5'-phosphate oxidase